MSGVAVDALHLYWTNFVGGTIVRANLNGSGANQSFIGGASTPEGVAIDPLPAPNTTIQSAAINRNRRKATFSFSSSQPGSSFRCSLDGRVFEGCGSPKTYTGLARGPHTFRVRAQNSQGLFDPSPATRSFTI